MNRPRMAAAAALLAMLSACDIADVATVRPQDLPVVEAMLRAGSDTQQVLLHRTQGSSRSLVGTEIAILAGDSRYRLEPARLEECLAGDRDEGIMEASCFILSDSPSIVSPGTTLRLEARTGGAEAMTGETTVPGTFGFLTPELDLVPGGRATCELDGNAAVELMWSRAEGAWAYLARLELHGLAGVLPDLELEGLPDPLTLTGVAVSASDTTLTLPTDFGLLERGDLPRRLLLSLRNGLPPGVRAELTLAAIDANYANAIREPAFNPSGMVRIPSVVGEGTGVFGSLVPLHLSIDVGAGRGEGTPLRCE